MKKEWAFIKSKEIRWANFRFIKEDFHQKKNKKCPEVHNSEKECQIKTHLCLLL